MSYNPKEQAGRWEMIVQIVPGDNPLHFISGEKIEIDDPDYDNIWFLDTITHGDIIFEGFNKDTNEIYLNSKRSRRVVRVDPDTLETEFTNDELLEMLPPDEVDPPLGKEGNVLKVKIIDLFKKNVKNTNYHNSAFYEAREHGIPKFKIGYKVRLPDTFINTPWHKIDPNEPYGYIVKINARNASFAAYTKQDAPLGAYKVIYHDSMLKKGEKVFSKKSKDRDIINYRKYPGCNNYGWIPFYELEDANIGLNLKMNVHNPVYHDNEGIANVFESFDRAVNTILEAIKKVPAIAESSWKRVFVGMGSRRKAKPMPELSQNEKILLRDWRKNLKVGDHADLIDVAHYRPGVLIHDEPIKSIKKITANKNMYDNYEMEDFGVGIGFFGYTNAGDVYPVGYMPEDLITKTLGKNKEAYPSEVF